MDSRPEKEETRATRSRRSFLDVVLKTGVVAWLAAMAAPTLVYLWPARSQGARSTRAAAGSAKDFPAGTARMVQAEGAPILVIRLAEDRFKAFSAICTHLGCIVKWEAGTRDIRCPCHAAVFSADGKVVSGPPSRPLVEYQVTVSGDDVVVKL
ncbi:MAG: Rieske (2Fe-2S) protein [Planctomycetes bacterium]|nr:Rieske (2Fe-2S) protein [Planctomycetota bacterium]